MLKKMIYSQPENKKMSYPFNLKWLKKMNSLDFQRPLTFIVGDNGVGKSTLIQALGIQAQLPQLTNQSYDENPEYKAVSELAAALKLQWSPKLTQGFFFRADDFISFIRNTNKLRQELEDELDLLDRRGVSDLAFERQPYLNSLAALKRSYPKALHELSHGQSFLALFKSRLSPNSLYILDEPETPLSPQNQLTLLCLIDEQIKQGSQFIIASHSPILTAHPEAAIYEISSQSIEEIAYDDIDNVAFMKPFMADPKRFMHYALKE